MRYEKVRKKMQEGKSITRKSGAGCNKLQPFIYIVTASELSTAFKYGYGTYREEPVFKSTIVMRTEGNTLRLGWKPKKKDKSADDWEVVQ